MANDVTVTFNGQPASLLGAIAQIQSQLGGMQSSLDNTTASANTHGTAIDSLTDKVGNAFTGALQRGAGALMSFGAQLMQVFETMTLWRVMDQVTQALQEMTDAWFQLNEQTEKNIYTWKYLLPGGMQAANAMAQWTATESMQVPYTRQDMMNAITTMAGLNMNSQQIQSYLPMLASLGATRAPNANLSDIARYIAGAEYGRSMMLKYELHINPADLVPYGYQMGGGGKPANESTFLPALLKWSEAKGYYTSPTQNAAQDIAHNTFWGAWSSFIDRIQNFQLAEGGQGFQQLKVFLNDVSSWMDAHTGQLSALADLLAGALASGLRTAGAAAGEFFQAITGGKVSGVGGGLGSIVRELGISIGALAGGVGGGFTATGGTNSLADIFKTIGQVLGAPSVQQTLKNVGQFVGMAVGSGLLMLKDALHAVLQFTDSNAGHMIADLLGAVLGLAEAGGRLVVTLNPLWPLLGAIFAIVGPLLYPAIELLTISLTGLSEGLNWLEAQFQKLITFVQPWINAALDWGKHLVENFVAGLTYAWNHTGGAVLNWIGNSIKKVLGHSKPEEGPLHDDDVWMTHMMEGFESQIVRMTPRVVAATRNAASQIGAPMIALGGAMTSTSYGNAAYYQTINAATQTQIQAMIDASIAATYKWGNGQLRSPGGFRKPGGIGF